MSLRFDGARTEGLVFMNAIRHLFQLILVSHLLSVANAFAQNATTLRENYLVVVRVLKNGEVTTCGEVSVITGSPQFHTEAHPGEGKGMWMDLSGSLRPTGCDKIMVDYILKATTTGQPPPSGETAPGAQSLMKLDLGEEYPVFHSGELVYMLSVCIYRKAGRVK